MKKICVDGIEFIVTASTNGEIKIWDIIFILKDIQNIQSNKLLLDKVKPVYSINTNQRITSLTATTYHLEENIKKEEKIVI